MKKHSKNLVLRSVTVLMLASMIFLGSDCEDIINQINNNPCSGNNQIAGNWTLAYNEGTTNDICPGEQVQFPSSTGGTATLTCPNSTAVTRLYSVSGTTLTYTESGAQYEVAFTNDCYMVLSGINNGRILYYTSTTSDKKEIVSDKVNKVNSNSSEINK